MAGRPTPAVPTRPIATTAHDETESPSAPSAPIEPVEAGAPAEPVGLTFAGGDDFFAGVPRRDMTVRELLDLAPARFNDITAANAATGKALYTLTPEGAAAWSAKWAEPAEE